MRMVGPLAFLVCASCLLGGTCKHDVTDVRPKPTDAGSPSECSAACKHLRELGCEEGKPTPAGASCEDVCNNVERSGTVTLHPACVIHIKHCNEIQSCAYGGG
jgi:hypothetical protein